MLSAGDALPSMANGWMFLLEYLVSVPAFTVVEIVKYVAGRVAFVFSAAPTRTISQSQGPLP